MKIEMLGHANLLVRGGETAVLFDPLFHNTHHEGVYDVYPPREIDTGALPDFDAVVLSHAHADHFDLSSISLLPRGVPVLVPADPTMLAALEGLGFHQVIAVEDLDPIQAAALPEALATVVQSLLIEGGLVCGQRVLVHAGASGIGTMAVQVCATLGCPVWVTAGSNAKVARCVELGAQGGVDRHQARFADHTRNWSGGHGFDVILDPVGGNYLADNLRSLAVGGRLVVIGLLGGRSAELDLGRLLVKRLRVIGTVLRSRSSADKSTLIHRVRQDLWPYVERGVIRPVLDRTFPIERAEEAHALLASNKTVGKVALRVNTTPP